MRGINPEKIPELITKDVKIVEKEARTILKISPDEKHIEIIGNLNPRLNVMAVLGPSWGFGRGWKKVLLAEIGISRTRPYSKARGLGRKTDESDIPARRKWFSLSPYQYQLVAPILFKRIEGIAYERVSSWRTGSFSKDKFLIPAKWHFWRRKKKRFQKALIERDSFFERLRGIRFAISLKDDFFIQDIYWAEGLNKNLERCIKGLVNFVDLRLNRYKQTYRGRKSFRKLKGAREVEQRLKESFLARFPHLLIEVVRRLKEEKRNQFWHRIAEMIGWNGKETEERKLASLACSHPNLLYPKFRAGNIQLQVTTGLEKKEDYIVFEVFPRKK